MTTDLTLITCPHCDGEGGEIYHTGPGRYAAHSGCHLPFEATSTCSYCEGTGEVEVCAHCLEPFEVVRGEETCSCAAMVTATEVRRAA